MQFIMQTVSLATIGLFALKLTLIYDIVPESVTLIRYMYTSIYENIDVCLNETGCALYSSFLCYCISKTLRFFDFGR